MQMRATTYLLELFHQWKLAPTIPFWEYAEFPSEEEFSLFVKTGYLEPHMHITLHIRRLEEDAQTAI